MEDEDIAGGSTGKIEHNVSTALVHETVRSVVSVQIGLCAIFDNFFTNSSSAIRLTFDLTVAVWCSSSG